MGRALIVIPARLESQRFPHKLMLRKDGRTLLEWTYRQAIRCRNQADVIIATSDVEIVSECFKFNGDVLDLGNRDYPNGTQRAFAALNKLVLLRDVHYDRLVVLQADEPLIPHHNIQSLCRVQPDPIVTLVSNCPRSSAEWQDPNLVKAVMSHPWQTGKRVHWFTRSYLNYAAAHVGIYSFSIDAVSSLIGVLETVESKSESLEQLCWMSYYPIIAKLTDVNPLSINTPTDWQKFLELETI